MVWLLYHKIDELAVVVSARETADTQSVRFGSLADIAACLVDVALPPKADIGR